MKRSLDLIQPYGGNGVTWEQIMQVSQRISPALVSQMMHSCVLPTTQSARFRNSIRLKPLGTCSFQRLRHEVGKGSLIGMRMLRAKSRYLQVSGGQISSIED